jgi:hypothetical protein
MQITLIVDMMNLHKPGYWLLLVPLISVQDGGVQTAFDQSGVVGKGLHTVLVNRNISYRAQHLREQLTLYA